MEFLIDLLLCFFGRSEISGRTFGEELNHWMGVLSTFCGLFLLSIYFHPQVNYVLGLYNTNLTLFICILSPCIIIAGAALMLIFELFSAIDSIIAVLIGSGLLIWTVYKLMSMMQ